MSEQSRVFRCPECRTRRKNYLLLVAHIQSSGHGLCDCGGYHYKHRRGSPYCYSNPMAPVLHASRAGASDAELEEIEIDVAFSGGGKPLLHWPEK